MPSLTIENYVKTIFQVCADSDEDVAATGQIATSLDVSPGTVTSMLKTLNENGLAIYKPYEGVKLTDAGRQLALRVLRRHRLIELFLVRTLNLSWDEVHAEAENMEHAVSDWLIDRIDESLGHPTSDPHGDPIPRADGSMEVPAGQSLTKCSVGTPFRLVRVLNQSTDFLQYLSKTGLSIGVSGEVSANQAAAGIVSVVVAGTETTLSRDVADQLLVACE